MQMDRTPTAKVAAEIYEAHGAELVRFATAVVGPSEAQDVVSTTMTKLIGNGALSEAENPVALLYRATLNEARSHQRSAIRRRLRERRTAEALVTHNPEIRPEVARAVAGLSAQQRACVWLTYWGDLRVSDVAIRLGITEGSVKQHLHRARNRLQEVLDE